MLTRVNKGNARSAAASLATTGKILILLFAGMFVTTPFLAAQGAGISNFDLKSTADLSFAFDYNSSGSADHMVFYRPGTGVIFIVANTNGQFSTVFQSTTGIGTFDLMSPTDRLFAFDYNGSGYADHLVAYRPGTGIIYILGNAGGGFFNTVFSSTTGIADYDLKSTADVLMAFDFDGSGLSDHIVAYRPGAGIIHILNNVSGTFGDVYQSDTGIGGWDLSSTADVLLPFDYTSNGLSDHLVAYRPGTGNIAVLENRAQSNTFNMIYQSATGIGGYGLTSTTDALMAFDYTGKGYLNYLVAYHPGAGVIAILQPGYFNYTPVYEANDGIGSYDLMSSADKLYAFDYTGSGSLSSLVAYRPGTGIIYIIGNSSGNFSPLFMDATSVSTSAMFQPGTAPISQ